MVLVFAFNLAAFGFLSGDNGRGADPQPLAGLWLAFVLAIGAAHPAMLLSRSLGNSSADGWAGSLVVLVLSTLFAHLFGTLVQHPFFAVMFFYAFYGAAFRHPAIFVVWLGPAVLYQPVAIEWRRKG